MKKIIISISVFLFCLFFLKQHIYAACLISNVPSSTLPSTKITINITDIPECNYQGNGYCPALIVYDSNNKAISCRFLTNTTHTGQITTPSSGTSFKIQVESRTLDMNQAIMDQPCLNQPLNPNITNPFCQTESISLTGTTCYDPNKSTSCAAASVNQKGNNFYFNMTFNNAECLSFYVTSGGKDIISPTAIKGNTASVMVGDGWPEGTYKIEVRGPQTQSNTRGDLLATCPSFYYNGVSSIDQNNEDALPSLTPDLVTQVNKIVGYSMGIGGLVAFLLIVFGGFQIILSGGNPERVKAGKEMITSAIAGLFLIVFSVIILKLIGYDILQIPGFRD